MEPSPIRYTRAGDVSIAYRTLGDGPIDFVFISGAISNLELDWDEPTYADFMRRVASVSRVITFDRRGVGISDRVPSPSPPLMPWRQGNTTSARTIALPGLPAA